MEQQLSFFQSKPPTFDNGSEFLGFRVPAAQTFTSYSPSSDMDAYLQSITGLGGYQQRELLQSPAGSSILTQSANGQAANTVNYLGFPGYHSQASCQQDADCGDNQICYTFNEQTFGPQQGPTCSPTVYPEVIIGNNFNNGKPLRQYSNSCSTNDDCHGTDEYSGKPKVGMSCNHYYNGPNDFSNIGLCQVQYENNGQRYHLRTPPGWTKPLNEKLNECNVQSDCGPSGVNGWARCVGGSDDGKNYCVWPGQTYTPNPKELKGQRPSGATGPGAPKFQHPTKAQQAMLNMKSAAANQPQFASAGGSLRNVAGPPANPNNLFTHKENFTPMPANLRAWK
jgi:hypothetical protein